MNDKLLLQKLKNRDEHALSELLKTQGPLLRYVMAPILQNPQDMEECLSEAAMKIWNGLDSFDESRGSFRAWITAIARNTALNHTRRKNPATEPLEQAGDVPAATPSPEEEILKKEQRQLLLSALEELSGPERMLFYRKYYYLQPTAQIARELGWTERAVEGRLYRLKHKLRKRLGGELDV